MNCKLSNVSPVTQLGEVESILHKQLKKRFPNNNIDGDNSFYVYVREDPDFIDFFGDWQNPTIYEKIVKQSETTSILNSQGEPNLQEDYLGSYFLNINGGKQYLNDVFTHLTSKELNELVNSLSGEYILNPTQSLYSYIKDKLTNRYKELDAYIIKKEEELFDISDDLEVIRRESELDPLRIINDKLYNIINDNTLLLNIEKKVNNNLEKDNFKITEDVSDKEDNSTHEDILNYILESNETSNRAINDVEILKFLSSIPKFKNNSYNEDVTLQEKELNPILLSDSYMDQSKLWSILENLFSNVIPQNNTEFTSKDLFDNFRFKLEQAVKYTKHPELNYVLNKLNSVTDENFKTKLVTAFFKGQNNFIITQVENVDLSNITFKLVDPKLTSGKKGKLLNEYVETAINNKYNLFEIKEAAIGKFNKIKNNSDKEVLKKFLTDLLIDDLKFNINPRSISFLVENNTTDNNSDLINLVNKFLTEKNYITQTEGEIETLNSLRKDIGSKTKDTLYTELNKAGTFLTALSEADTVFKDEVSEATVIVAGKQRWQYSNMSSILLEILKWQSGDISSLKKLANRNFKIVNYLLEDPSRIQNIKLYTNSEIKKENDPNPVLHKDITEVDLHLDIFVKMFNSKDKFYEDTVLRKQGKGAKEAKELVELSNYLVYNFGADKNSLFSLFGLPRPNAGMGNIYNIEKNKLGKDFKNLLSNYVKGELNKAKEEGLKIAQYFQEDNKKKYLMENLIPDYHFKTKKDLTIEDLTPEDFSNGIYHNIGIFSKALDKYLEKNSYLVYNNDLIPIVEESFIKGSNFKDLMDLVYQEIEDNINSDYEYLSNLVLIDTIDNRENEVFKTVFDVNTNINFENKSQAIYTYIISSFLNSYELSNIFNGHISYYKQKEDINLDDFLKRAPAITTDGLYLRHRNTGESKTYTTFNGEIKKISDKDDKTIVAVVNDPEDIFSSSKDLINAGLDSKNKLNYKHEIADAQGFITANHFRDLIERIYGWSPYDQQMFDELNNKDHKYTDENIRWIKKFSKAYTPLKMVHFEVNEEGVPIYLKYSVAPLFDAITAGSEMQKVADQMNKQGVEQIVFKSGSKGSNYAPTNIHNSESNEYKGLKDNIIFNPFEIDSNLLKMQVQLPTKLDGSITLGNQSIKNIQSNLELDNPDKVYEFRNEKLSAKEVYDEINLAAVSILQTQLNSVLNKLGYKDNKFNTRLIKKLLVNQMDIESELDIINILKTDLPLETIPNFSQRAFPVISKYLHKNAGKIYTNGSSVVQVANLGFDRLDNKAADGIFIFDKSNSKLTPPVPITDNNGNILYFDELGKPTTKDKGLMKISKAKILLPFTSIFKNTGLSYNEFIDLYKKGVIDKNIFKNALGYRIPNQSMSSNDSFEIIGILPPLAGDQAIVYHEITAKTGSDYDIDKMYMLLPNYKVTKDTYIPDENKWTFGNEVPHIHTLLKEFEVDSIKDIFTVLNQDKEIKEYINNKGKNALKIVLDNYDEILNIAETNNVMSKEDIEVVELLKDLKAAYLEQLEIIKRTNKEVYDKFSKQKISKVEYISDNGYRGKQNRLIELLNSILESPSTYNDLMSPLDNPIIKNTINNIKYKKALLKKEIKNSVTESEYLKSIKKSGLAQMFPVNLVKARVEVLEAKNLISIMANNMTDLGESQKVNFALSYPIGIKHAGNIATALDRVYMLGEDGNPDMKLTKIVSYLMNAAVDAAKDNYIIEGNFRSYTANSAMLLVRLGLNLNDVFTILMNDTITNFTTLKTNAKAKVAEISVEYDQEKLNDLSVKYLKELVENDNDLFKVISREDFLSNNIEKKDLILGFWNLLQETSKEFNESVVITKADANGPGKNIPEFITLINKINRVNEGGMQNTFKKWFDNGITAENFEFNPNIKDNPNVKYLGAMANNTLFLMDKLSKELFIETTDQVRDVLSIVSSTLGSPLSNDTATVKLIYNYLYSNILYNTGHKIYNIDYDQEKYLLKDFTKELKEYKDNNDNAFINELFINTRDMENLITFPNFKNFSNKDKVMLKEAFTEFINTTAVENGNSLADNLIQYAFLTTGFKSTYYSFNDIIPSNYFLDNMHGKAIQKFINKNDIIDPEKTLINIAKSNFNNFKIVRKAKIISGIPVTKEKLLDKVTNKNGIFRPFIISGKSLLMLTKIQDGRPVYSKIEKRDTSKFKKFSFNNIENGLLFQENKYKSTVKELNKGLNNLDDEIFNCEIK